MFWKKGGKMPESEELKNLERKIGINFKNKKLLRQAMVHRSFINENSSSEVNHNERLEFLGDAVLEMVVTEHLYEKYPNPEGELTNWRAALVRRETLAESAKKISLGDFLYLSKGERKTGGQSRELILANAFEALIGAIYLDKDYPTAKKFIEKHLLYRLKEILKKKLYVDPKSRLQELTQEKYGITPLYKLLSESGPDHRKSFTVGVYLKTKLIGEGSGSSKQAAEQAAASSALEKLS